jgi:hypothetical protein
MGHDELRPNPLPCQPIQDIIIIRVRLGAPKTGFSDIGAMGTELVTKETKQTKNQIAVPCGIRHDFVRMESGLLFDETFEETE